MGGDDRWGAPVSNRGARLITPNFTELELAVLDAIADETTDPAPELPGQIADARVVDRIQTSAGFITHIQVDPARTAPIQSAPAQLGTIHADVGPLADPVGFRAVIEHGRLTGLEADAYGQDTSAVDFASASFGGLFRIDADGVSVPVPPPSPALQPRSPLHRVQQEKDPLPSSEPELFRPKDFFAHDWGERYSPDQVTRLKTERLPFPLHILFMAIDIAWFGAIAVFFFGLHERIPVLSHFTFDAAVTVLIAVGLSLFLLRWALHRHFSRQADG